MTWSAQADEFELPHECEMVQGQSPLRTVHWTRLSARQVEPDGLIRRQWFKSTNHAMARRFRMFVDRPTPYDQVKYHFAALRHWP